MFSLSKIKLKGHQNSPTVQQHRFRTVDKHAHRWQIRHFRFPFLYQVSYKCAGYSFQNKMRVKQHVPFFMNKKGRCGWKWSIRLENNRIDTPFPFWTLCVPSVLLFFFLLKAYAIFYSLTSAQVAAKLTLADLIHQAEDPENRLSVVSQYRLYLTDGNMVAAAVLFLLTVGSVCGKAEAERKLVYVTVVSNINNRETLRKLRWNLQPRLSPVWRDVCGTVFKI